MTEKNDTFGFGGADENQAESTPAVNVEIDTAAPKKKARKLEKVNIMLNRRPGGAGGDSEVVSVNGAPMKIPVDENCDISPAYFEVLERAVRKEYRQKKVPDAEGGTKIHTYPVDARVYPYTVNEKIWGAPREVPADYVLGAFEQFVD